MSTSVNMKSFRYEYRDKAGTNRYLAMLRRFDGIYSIRLDVRYVLLNAILGRLEKPLQRKNIVR